MAKKHLHNRVNSEELKELLMKEPFNRVTFSFYRYVLLDNPQEFRDSLYTEWEELGCFGRIYVAHEGINAQMSVPEYAKDDFLKALNARPELKNMPIKWAVEDNGKSFYKLAIKVRPKIVADGLDDNAFDVTNVGTHLSATEFHDLVDAPGTIVIDMRNHYESEIGHFKGAICPDADTFKDEIKIVVDEFKDKKDEKILLYCTGGIRCEKASAYLRHHGFSDVNQLHGGIIEYARQINAQGLESKFIGKNFVFDERLGERITHEIIAECHQCAKPADTHTNCANEDCHILFIQCAECAEKYEGCCSVECRDFTHLTEEEKQASGKRGTFTRNFKKRLRPNLSKMREELSMCSL